MNDEYKPLFPWFGGKSAVADLVWSALGDVQNYVEPFFGSGAVLFMRPHGPGIETVNDADGFVANFWRAVRADPEAVAKHADNPVNECDLHARHVWLVNRRESMTDRLCGDPEWFDARAAGWWVWGQCCWIGSGWCSGNGPWTSVDGVMVKAGAESGSGVNRQMPHLGNAGRGVNRDDDQMDRIRWFSDRLRRVRVCCGDWARVTGPTPTFKHSITGVFVDPPYAAEASREMGCYAVDSESVAHDVRRWAIEAGRHPLMRIVLAGYEGEHNMPPDWRVIAWKTRGGYGNQGNEDSRGRANSGRERLWLSPACLYEDAEAGLFSAAAGGGGA